MFDSRLGLILRFDFDLGLISTKLLCNRALRHTHVKERYRNIAHEEETTHVIVHIGTNDLKRERHNYAELSNTLKELFRAAEIKFSAVLPRWDSDPGKSHCFSIVNLRASARHLIVHL